MKMLVALDRSSFSEEVLPAVAAVASAGETEIALVTVVKASDLHGTRTGPAPKPTDLRALADATGRLLADLQVGEHEIAETSTQAEQRVRTESAEYIESIARKWFPQGADIAVLGSGDVAERLAVYAREHDVDIIAMATHGRTGLAKALKGSVAGALLQSRVAPLLLVRPETS